MILHPEYDIAIIGGGLAGLAASILLSRKGYTVVLLEKERYPFHRVCGEYISYESHDFLLSLGLPLNDWDLPSINTLHLTAANGKKFITRLPLGGFGISRYKLDAALAQIARQSGVHLLENSKADVAQVADGCIIRFHSQAIRAKLCLAAHGKRSNLDVKWNRGFLQGKNRRLNQYLGVKYHVATTWPAHVIGLHHFENGYCGISKIEEDRYCLCYLTRAENLKKSRNSIEKMQEEVLFRNPHIRQLFSTSRILQDFPVTISQISFAPKSKVEHGALMLGDAAGMITPLCGNGMSIALHTAKIAAALTDEFLKGRLSQTGLEAKYRQQWQQHFAFRIGTGRLLHYFFGNNRLNNLFVNTFRAAPFLARPVIRLTHGKPF